MVFTIISLTLVAPMTSFARGAGESFAPLVDKISPAVVNIVTSVAVTQALQPDLNIPNFPKGSPFEQLFRDFLNQNGQNGVPQGGQEPQLQRQALGSGFIVSADGLIVTNNHVIADADQIEIETFSGATYVAEIVGRDERTDIAVLKITSDTSLPFVTFADSDQARVGDWVMAVGNPLGQGFSVSAGIISARNRQLSGAYDDFIQTDAAINRGNSGGPLFNMNGEVVGVNTAILSPNGGSIGIGFSMSSNVVKQVVDQLSQFGETRRGWLGVRIQDMNEDIAAALNMDSPEGALVTDVPDGPAANAGILAGDVIVNFNGTSISNIRELVRVVADTAVGKVVPVEVMRDGKSVTIDVTLGRLESAFASNAGPAPTAPKEQLTPPTSEGLTLGILTPDLQSQLNLPESAQGVVILDVASGSAADRKGLQAGDLILEVGKRTVVTPDDVLAAFADARDSGRQSVLLLVARDGNKRFVGLPLR